MIVGFLLVLAFVSPDGRIAGKTYQMPTYKVCERAMKEFLQAPEKIDEDAPTPRNGRSATCLSIPAGNGHDT